jgi:H/ACA ribonucleoprotein complex subunit 2
MIILFVFEIDEKKKKKKERRGKKNTMGKDEKESRKRRKRSDSKSEGSSKKKKQRSKSTESVASSSSASSSSSSPESTAPVFPSAIAQPMGDDKLVERVLRLVRKGAKDKKLCRGVKEVVKGVTKRKPDSPDVICLIAGDISPVDVVAHLPTLCDEYAVSYIYVPSKLQLGIAASTKRSTSTVLISRQGDSVDLFDRCLASIAKIHKKWQPPIH